ncbi:cupin domain-containing protein [Silicimonas algicola]|uniref:Transcriptional regulator n=1 Tax=Silicimonas algicola TaxID=1826607 RepID=A0A316G3N7_9RHOB|nr:winged helix-turn-helix domain-containing protein [Silicimonas algicola]AZQ66812.1 cupin domain-containing protein [Silicimonas algicola]PWK55283.1 transcriptional regulator [Silicimonas algicola]
MRYVFANFLLDTATCELKRGQTLVALRPKSYDLLNLLVERAGSVVGKNALQDALWPDVTVQENSLTQCVADLRRRLGDEEGHLIRTVPKRGYMFTSSVTREDDLRGRSKVRPLGAAAGLLILGALLWLNLLPKSEANIPPTKEPRVLLDTKSTVLDQPLVWPASSARLMAGITVIAPGEASEWHTHAAPLFAYVISGEIVTDYGTPGERRYRAGDALIEAVDWPHQARNVGAEWAEVLYVLVGSDDTPLRSSADILPVR